MIKSIKIANIAEDRVEPAFKNNNVPICLFSSNEYAPYCGVLIYSLIESSSPENNYDIIILNRDISENNKALMGQLIESRKNISIRFIDTSSISEALHVNVHGHFALESCLKLFLLSNVFEYYTAFVATDSDLVFNHDVAELYNIDIGDNYMAAVDDVIMKRFVAQNRISGDTSNAPHIRCGAYITEYLGMPSADKYYNTGVVVFNLKRCREDGVFEKVFELINTKEYWFLEQDVLNEVCGEKIYELDYRWNVLNGDGQLNSIKNYLSEDQLKRFSAALDDHYIMHFAGSSKPWINTDIDYADVFFAFAGKTPWYRDIIFRAYAPYHNAVLNTVFISDIRSDRISPAFSQNNVPICMFSSSDYAPFCGVLINSIIKNSDKRNCYDIVILERNISLMNKEKILNSVAGAENVSVRFVNLSNVSGEVGAQTYGYYVLESCLKLFLLSDVFEGYEKFIALDSDLVLNRDVADLLEIDIDGKYMAAVDDIVMHIMVANKEQRGQASNAPHIPAGDYIIEHIGLETDNIYYNTGVIVLNLAECRKQNLYAAATKLVTTKAYWFLEQDVLNELCAEHTLNLDYRWNTICLNAEYTDFLKKNSPNDLFISYCRSIEEPFVMHFAGGVKPWSNPFCDHAEYFFKYARDTIWYELIILNIIKSNVSGVSRAVDSKFRDNRNLINANFNTINSNAWKMSIKSFAKSTLRLLLRIRYGKNEDRRIYVYNQIKRWKDKNYRNARKQMHLRFLKGRINKLFHLKKEHYNYDKIKRFKNKYKGQRCFIVGTGPSLTPEQLDLLKDEVTFSLNSIYKLFDKTSWRPTFYVQNDMALDYGMALPQSVRWDELKSWLCKYQMKNLIFTSSNYNREIAEMAKGECFFIPVKETYYDLIRKDPPKFGKNCAKCVYSYRTTIYLITQIARYMGFSEICLVGTDANYMSGKVHAYDEDKDYRRLFGDRNTTKIITNDILLGFKAIRYHSEKLKFKVFNCTPGGNLEYFQRFDLVDLVHSVDMREVHRKIEVSIIVPVYNSAKYLRKCFSSLVNQTFESLEIIAVNNGSTDNSLVILNQFSKKYPDKVRVVSIEHHNYAGAGRNKGIQLAKGKYIAFSDSDDEMPDYAIEKMYKRAIETNAELVVGPHLNVKRGKRVLLRSYENIGGNDIREYFTKIEPAPWGKLFRKDFVDRIGFMPENFCFEDLAWYLVYITYVENVAYCPTIGYIYHEHSNSQVHSKKNVRILDTIKAEKYGYDNCKPGCSEYIVYYIAMRIRVNMKFRPYFMDEWQAYLSTMWGEISQNPYVIKDIALYNFLEKQVNGSGDDRS
ncbi:MAG: glycosyltransferase [Bacteroides sp.]|nr:glycosyltransferase [Eubacterium sp.]MCM1417972.1 glycosyltransferase [Roseburia sp.]MCM1461781.1 glycosyltransferase [Bacteroides sp.]